MPDDWDFDPSALDAPYLCSLSDIGDAIDDRDLEALVVTREFDRAEVDRRLFAEVVARPVQVMELHEFHEHRFGSVPLAEIDYAWFTRLAGSHYKPLTRALKRGLDLVHRGAGGDRPGAGRGRDGPAGEAGRRARRSFARSASARAGSPS